MVIIIRNYYLGRKLRFLVGVGFFVRGFLVIFGGILGYYNWRGCFWYLGVEGRDVVKFVIAYRTVFIIKNYLVCVNGVEVEKFDI